MNNLFIKGLLIYSNIRSFVSFHLKNTPIVKTIYNSFLCFLVKYTEFYYQIKKEKPNNWCSISYIENTHLNSPKYNDFYTYLLQTTIPPTIPTIKNNQIYDTCLEEQDKKKINSTLFQIQKIPMDKKTYYANDFLMTIRHNNFYYCKIVKISKTSNYYFPMNFIKSEIKFIAIEYNHPSLKTPIPIDLRNFQFVIGSEILNYVFVQRYLKYKFGNKYKFSLDYTLRIIDSKYSIFELKPTNYLLLGRNLFIIKDITE